MLSVLENLPAGAEVGRFEVTDRDHGAAAENTFSLRGLGADRFSVEIINITQMSSANSQPPTVTLVRIITSQLLDREDVSSYQFTITAEDQTDVPLSASAFVTVLVQDDNDNNPLFDSPSYTFVISESTTNLLVMNFTVS